jgi:uncharacterized protein
VRALRELLQVVDKVDATVSSMSETLAPHLSCRRGCSSCCVDGLTVLPVEAARITEHLNNTEQHIAPHPTACAFLDSSGACQIYEARPVLCRTHGLPLLAGSDVTVCELNFTTRAPTAAESIDATRLQSLLVVVNARHPDGAGPRVPLRALAASSPPR